MPRPPADVNWTILIGGVLVFFGFLLLGIADFAYVSLPVSATYERVFATYMLYVAGEIAIGVGFLLAFVGIAWKRP